MNLCSSRHLYSLFGCCLCERTHFVLTWIVMCKFSGNIRVDLPGTIYLKQATILILSVQVSRHRPDHLQNFVNILMHLCFPLFVHLTETVQSHRLKETAWVGSPNTHTSANPAPGVQEPRNIQDNFKSTTIFFFPW